MALLDLQTRLDKSKSILSNLISKMATRSYPSLKKASDVADILTKPVGRFTETNILPGVEYAGSAFIDAPVIAAMEKIQPGSAAKYKRPFFTPEVEERFSTGGNIDPRKAATRGTFDVAKAGLSLFNVAKQPANILAGGLIGAAGQTISNISRKRPLTEDIGRGIESGVEASYILPITNAITDAVAVKFFPKLVEKTGQTGLPFRVAKSLSNKTQVPLKVGGKEIAKVGAKNAAVIKGVINSLERAILETPAETVGFAAWDSVKEDKKFRDAVVEEFLPVLIGNLAFGAGRAGAGASSVGINSLKEQFGDSFGRAIAKVLKDQRGFIKIAATQGEIMNMSLDEFKKLGGTYDEYIRRQALIKEALPKEPKIAIPVTKSAYQDMFNVRKAIESSKTAPDKDAVIKNVQEHIAAVARSGELSKQQKNLRLDQIAKFMKDILGSEAEIGGTVPPTGKDILKKFQGKTVGEIQQAVQSPDLTAYENAIKTGDFNILEALSEKYPTDTRFQIHKKLPGFLRSVLGSERGFINIETGTKAPTQPAQMDAVQKITEALKKATPIRGEQERLYSVERARRAARVVDVGTKVPGEAGFRAQLGELKGELPKVDFEGIRKQVTQADIDDLFNRVEGSKLSPFEKITAKNGLAKLLGAEGGTVPTKSEIGLLNEIFPPEFVKAVLDKRPIMQRLFQGTEEILNVPRAIMASADLSAPFRQGVFLIGRPRQWLPAFKDMFKYAADEKAYKQMLDEIESRPSYPAMRESGLALTRKQSALLEDREEAFMSNLAEKIPGLGKIIGASSRAYSGFLDRIRADTFDDLLKRAGELGVTEETHPGFTKDIAKFVNSATGRGDLGSLNRASTAFNSLFFSPRLMASRLNLLNPKFYADLDPFVRKEALKSLFSFAGTALTTLTLASLAGAEVETDPRNANFGKIKVNNTRFDILGGFQQYIKLASQLITGKIISSTTGEELVLGEGYRPLTRKDILIRFLESKEAPVASFITQLLEGTTSTGEKFELTPEVINRLVPMYLQDMYDLYKEEGPKGILWSVPGIFGVGIQTYGRQVPKVERTESGKVKTRMVPVPGLEDDIYNLITGREPSEAKESDKKVKTPKKLSKPKKTTKSIL